MIKSLFRQMWNQRHANVWVWVELIVVLILLWYSIDLVYNYEVAARQSKGYDTENVFDIQLNIKPALQNDSVLMSHSAEYLEQIYHLIQQYQGVEEACFYYGTIPYTGKDFTVFLVKMELVSLPYLKLSLVMKELIVEK